MIGTKLMWAATVIATIVVAALAVRRRSGFRETLVSLIFTAYIGGLVAVTLFPIPVDPRLIQDRIAFGGQMQNNFVPLATIVGAYQTNPRVFAYQVFGNLLLLLPLGILAPLVSCWMRRPRNAFATVFLFAIGIEAAQLLISAAVGMTYRSFDVDDILLNFAGGIAGYGLFNLLARSREALVGRGNGRDASSDQLKTTLATTAEQARQPDAP